MNLIVHHQFRQQFYSLYKDTTPFIKYSGTPFCLKAKQVTSLGSYWNNSLGITSLSQSKAFSRSTNIKNIVFFWVWFFFKSQNKHCIISPFPWQTFILHFVNIYHLSQMSIQNPLVQFKSIFQQLYSSIMTQSEMYVTLVFLGPFTS